MAKNLPLEPDSDFFKKKVTVIGIIGKTQGVKSAAKPEIKAIIKKANNWSHTITIILTELQI